MYISHIKINNFRNFSNFEMDFQDGLNVIVGSNNSGKTGLLRAIDLLNNPGAVSVDDFNKNDLLVNFLEKYKQQPPEIIIEYDIIHEISEDNTEDESIIKLLSFIGMDKINESKAAADDPTKYSISAKVKAIYSMSPKDIGEYISAVSAATDYESFYNVLQLFEKSYSWAYTNGLSETRIDSKEATEIFKVDFIEAERNSEAVYNETKREIERFLKNDPSGASKIQEIQKGLSDSMKDAIKPVLDKISNLVENEKNDIGLSKGNVAISQDMRPSATISNSYVINVRDTKSDFIIPLSHNGLGYNNLINMYMLVKLVEIQKGKDFRILCLEEPEAHLHPAMQYKLFKFLKKLDEEDNLNQQIFVTTHSSNITAVAGLNNMYMLSYSRTEDQADCVQRSLKIQFEEDETAKNHMMKFLDVTRSDMLFADKVILVEGLAEKLLFPKLMEKCNYSYEDEHISIVEVGGKNFAYFLRAFANNPVKKDVLCITDSDFKWIKDDETTSLSDYAGYIPAHVNVLSELFSEYNNICVMFQKEGGSTFEDELFISNFENTDVAKKLLKVALSESLHPYIDANQFNFDLWDVNREQIDGRSRSKITNLIDSFKNIIAAEQEDEKKDKIKKLFFGKLFLEYAKDCKGDIALSILVDEELVDALVVPQYIREGIQWVSRT